MTINGRGKQPTPSYLASRELDLAYLKEMGAFNQERFSRADPTWTEEDRDLFITIWAKYYGKIGKEKNDNKI